MAGQRGITLQWACSRYIYGRHDGIRVRFDVLEACEMSDKIFAYRMLPLSPQTGSQVGHFSHICSPPDLEEYPEDLPLPGHQPEWFRLNYVDVLVRSREEAEDLIDIVRSDARRIVATLKVMDTIEPGDTETMGATCPEPVPGSSEPLPEGSDSSASLGSLQCLTAVGTTEQSIGVGQPWEAVGAGAGSPLDDASVSRVTLTGDQSSEVLLVQGFDFALLPADAVIEGISVRVSLRDATLGSAGSEGSSTSAAPCPQLCYLTLHHPDAGLLVNKATLECIEGPDNYQLTFGDEDDLWNGIWTSAMLQRGEFGISLVVGIGDGIDHAIVEVDGAEITVCYR